MYGGPLNLHNHAVSDNVFENSDQIHVKTIYVQLKHKYKAFLLVEVRGGGASIRAA